MFADLARVDDVARGDTDRSTSQKRSSDCLQSEPSEMDIETVSDSSFVQLTSTYSQNESGKKGENEHESEGDNNDKKEEQADVDVPDKEEENDSIICQTEHCSSHLNLKMDETANDRTEKKRNVGDSDRHIKNKGKQTFFFVCNSCLTQL